MPKHLLALTAAVLAALGAGAVASSAQTTASEPVPAVADTGALAAECARPLPNPVSRDPRDVPAPRRHQGRIDEPSALAGE